MGAHDDWDGHWDQFADAASQNPAQQMRHRFVIQLLREQGAEQGEVLDVGSGQGDLCRLLSQEMPGSRLAGFELSARGVEVSQEKVPDGAFHVVDLFNPPADVAARYQGWATHAVCSEVLEHVDSPVELLRCAQPYLADGARLIVTVPGGPMSAFDRHIGHRQHFTRKSITSVLSDAGFKVERVYLAGFPFFNLYRLTVILRGKRLVDDVSSGNAARGATKLAGCVMKVFRALFRLNLRNSPWGWQVVAVGLKR